MYEVLVRAIGDLEGVLGFEVMHLFCDSMPDLLLMWGLDDERTSQRIYRCTLVIRLGLQYGLTPCLYSSVERIVFHRLDA
jgi:hypothetical protein